MKKTVLFLFVILATFLYSTHQTYAHFLATDGNIGAVLHVDPNDAPVANSQSSFFFEFKDKTNRFTSQKCDCTFEIFENGHNIFSQPLFQNNTNPDQMTASAFYTFPKIDVYQVKVVGKPITPNAFQPFMLIWTFRVDQDGVAQNSNNSLPPFLPWVLGLVVIAALLFLGTTFLRNKNNKQR